MLGKLFILPNGQEREAKEWLFIVGIGLIVVDLMPEN